MKISPTQAKGLLSIIDRNQLIAIGQELGPDFLTDADRATLGKAGVNLRSLYKLERDTLFTNFHFGMLAESLQEAQVRKLTYDELVKYIAKGQYIPLTTSELATVDSIRSQTFTDIKTLHGRIFQDVNTILGDPSIGGQKNFLKREIEEGILNKDTIRKIANNIAEKTGDWSRDFDRIVTYTSTLAYEEGKAAMIQRNAGDEDPLVYKIPLPGACEHCVRLYCTGGIGSEPIIFKLSELRANGTNIGRKVKEWLATLGPVHPYCRCALKYLQSGKKWDKEKRGFEFDKDVKPKRKPIRVWIGGKETLV